MKVVTDTADRTSTLSTANFGHGYETNLNHVLAQQQREQYLALYTDMQRVSAAYLEGIQSVTLNTPSGSVTVQLYSTTGENLHKLAGTFYTELSEVLGTRLGALEHGIARHEADSQKEEEDEREGEGGRPEAFAFCMLMRPVSDAEFAAMPPEAQRAYLQYGATERPEAA